MGATDLIFKLRSDGYSIKADGGYLDIFPADDLSPELVRQLKLGKPEILCALNREEIARVNPQTDHTPEPTTAEKLHELSLLVEYVAENNGFSDEDIIEAKSNAENDLENALLSFRELARAVRQVKVLALLEADSGLQRAIYADTTSNEHYVTLAIAVFGYATCEVRVSKSRYDSFQLLDLVEKYGHQTH